MRILLVDDSQTIRVMIRRALAEMVRAEFHEAGNGVDALAEIARHRFDLVVMDVNMPVMDGLETLEAIRTTPECAALPVVMQTSEKSDILVRRLVELGITDFLAKPLSPDNLRERLTKILDRLKESAPQRGTGQAPGTKRELLVVEQDADRRHFLVESLHAPFAVTAADSAAAALQICLAKPRPVIDLVLVGQSIGVPPAPMFVTKLRGLLAGTIPLVLAVNSKGEPIDGRLRGLIDGVVETTCIPEVLLAEVQRAISGIHSPLQKILAYRPSLKKDVFSATEQVFGMMLSTDIEPAGPDADWHRRSGEHGAYATVDLVAEGHAVLTLVFRTDIESARTITARMTSVAEADVSDAEALASAAEIVNIVLGRVRNRLVEAGFPTDMQVPRTWLGEAGVGVSSGDPEAIELRFVSRRFDIAFELLLFAAAEVSAGVLGDRPAATAGCRL